MVYSMQTGGRLKLYPKGNLRIVWGIKVSVLNTITDKNYSEMDRVFLQSGLEESFFNPLCDKQIDYPHVYFKKLYDSLKMSCD